ncbi:type III pantothenate kinase, partial [Vicingaceae bacterium]|nr:type III pantothenate kinase [Vicingaceae bacterium]
SPDTLGKDRIAAVAGAQGQFPNQNTLVIDAGTCVTYDFLTAEGDYLGGAISPGVQLRLQAMNDYTSKLPLLKWEGADNPQSIGDTTITSMLSGAVNGLISEMRGFIESYEKQYKSLKIVITGGDSNFFVKELKNGIFADPNLVLKGLNDILIYNGE